MATQSEPTNMLLRCHRDYVAELGPVTERDVYAGFGGVMSGLVLRVVGWGVYLWVEFGGVPGDAFWTVRELAFGSVGVGVPLLIGGAITGLVGVRDVGRAAVAGGVLCLVGLALLSFRLGGAVSCRVSE